MWRERKFEAEERRVREGQRVEPRSHPLRLYYYRVCPTCPQRKGHAPQGVHVACSYAYTPTHERGHVHGSERERESVPANANTGESTSAFANTYASAFTYAYANTLFCAGEPARGDPGGGAGHHAQDCLLRAPFLSLGHVVA